jgi:Xaa-Pro dipeptidase
MDEMDETLTDLYPAHLLTVRRRFDAALERSGYDAIVIGAGIEIFRFLDDQAYPFGPNPHFLQWAPLTMHPESCLIYAPGRKPLLVVCQPDDFWHKPPPLPEPPWRDHFELKIITTADQLPQHLAHLPARTALIGDPAQWRHGPDDEWLNPPALLDDLHYHRPYKTDYEIECIRVATSLAVPAHRAAEMAFRQGGSEHEIWIAFLDACRQTANELPYPAIIATNDNGALLHYQHYKRKRTEPHSLLIDAGCSRNGYAADITRTHAFDDPEFAGMVADLDRVQQKLVAEIRPGLRFADLHQNAHRSVADLISDWQLVRRNADELVQTGVSALFFPHGLGHFLGLQIHDMGGTLADPSGTPIDSPDRYPNLRLLRTLEAGQVLTIEPGFYFIDSLLERLRRSPVAGEVDWKRIDHLKKFGGIRIEDNIVVTATGAENLTRQAFSAHQ